MSMRRSVIVPTWILLALVGGLGFLLMALSYVLGQTSAGVSHLWSGILYEIGKAAFIGSTAGAFVRSILPKLAEDENKPPLSQCGIDAVYTNREEARSLFLQAVSDSRTRTISMIGISLREFLLQGRLHEIWEAIRERLKLEKQSNIPDPDRLKVRLLLLDPTCPEGDFRVQVEKDLPQRLNEDVPVGIQTVIQLCHELDPSRMSSRDSLAHVPPVLEARLYQHGSFAFQFITDSFAIVQQYAYHDRYPGTSMPLLQYKRFSDAYEQLQHSYDIVWNSSRTALGDQLEVGVGQALRESHLVGIFRQDDRGLLTAREQHVLRSCRPGEIVAIQALSGRFYMQQIIGDIEAAARPVGRCAKVRLLIVNPISRGAILRAVADSTPIENIGDALRGWTWKSHIDSNLYDDIHSAINRVGKLREAGCDIEVRLSAADLPCAMLLAAC